MLTRFTVANYKSFDKPQTLSLIAGNVQKHKERLFIAPGFKVLKFGAIYGANASGKSNLIYAMHFALALLHFGTKACNQTSFFRLNSTRKKKASYFEFEFVLDGKNYAYGFEVLISDSVITEEWLVELNPEKNITIYSRNTENQKYTYEKSMVKEVFQKRMNIYLDDFKSIQDKLFLESFVFEKTDFIKNNPQLNRLKDIVRWLFNINVSFPNTPITGFDCLTKEDSVKLIESLKGFATGITNIIFKDVAKEYVLKELPRKDQERIEDDLLKYSKLSHCKKDCRATLKINGNLFFVIQTHKELRFQEVLFEHNNIKNVLFSLGDESDGTQRLLDLLSVVLSKEKNSVFVIDEIDRCLHPQLTVFFVKKFLSLAKRRNIQLLISTHESHLLNLDILRQDEIFFVEKKDDGSSEIYPFDRFKVRFDKKIEAAYLEGRYGAVPIFESIFSFDDKE